MDAGVSRANASCLRVAVISYLPHIALLSQGPNPKVGGTLASVLDIIARYLGFCYKFVVPSDLVYGSVLANGTLTGTLGAVVNGEADMTGLLTVREARVKYLDFSEPLYMEQVQVAVKRPVLEPDVVGFVKPLSGSVWLVMVAAMLLTALACTLLPAVWRASTLGTPRSVSAYGCGGQALLVGSLPSLLWCLAVLLSQSTRWVHSAASLRVVASMWFLASLILATVYRSNLKAMLIMPRVQLPFDNLEQLDKSQYPLHTTATSATHTAIVEAPEHSLLGRLKDQLVTHKSEMVMARLFYGGHRVALAGMSFSFRHHMNYAFSRSGFCFEYIMQGDRLLDGMSQALGFPKGSRLRPRVDGVILRLREAGLINHLVYRALPNSSHCLGPINQAPSSTKLRAQSLKDFYGLFSVYLSGNLLAILAFVAEIITRHGGNRKNDE